ncbi:MAG: trypsin-like serine protease [Lachnospiraceae bacterium]|jgi:Trypsin-like serine proteases, typically periplasmic, contain C-terminal PDZ domain|uniref:S1C family serine protease n=1 Tax=Roseburia sp. 1XD42-69 TaxID=2320088 RepID=UPI000EA0E2A8|nr:trypsin-like peptidase domain-containing protein [Roseburia sp. 1XD42-69]MCI8876215.1 trypsin-like serine protease [Lachnospiraceae bacterium]MCX4319432.1 trypsin-like peptidase domain-containing protein [Lachnospiraceae bacterium]RKJ68134.1 PDZ domain-containing protein [Roseburia sp. 1XD42-69]
MNQFDENNSYETYYTPYEEPEKPPKKKSGFWGKTVRFTALALVFGLVAGTSFSGTSYFFDKYLNRGNETGEEKSGADLNIAQSTENLVQDMADKNEIAGEKSAVTDVSSIVDMAMPSIVSITTISTTRVRSFFGYTQEYESEGCGSGIIISQDEENLYIATNNHVVAGANTLSVIFSDDSLVTAKVKGTDPNSDLAVVSVKLSDIDQETKGIIRTATFGESRQVKVGQAAVAIGNALGYGQSVTKGVISAVDREVTVQDESNGSSVTNSLLQTDAAINPGNSGGALLNIRGEVIGINSVKYSETSVEGMGYAIPADAAIPIIKQLITREVVRGSDSAYFGASGVDMTEEVAKTYNMPMGVYIAQVVEGSGADKAGLVQGDIITKFDGRNITAQEDIEKLMQYMSAGTTVEVGYKRAVNGEYEEFTVEVTLGKKN